MKTRIPPGGLFARICQICEANNGMLVVSSLQTECILDNPPAPCPSPCGGAQKWTRIGEIVHGRIETPPLDGKRLGNLAEVTDGTFKVSGVLTPVPSDRNSTT